MRDTIMRLKKPRSGKDLLYALLSARMNENAATISYYLLFSICPLVLFISAAFSAFPLRFLDKLNVLGIIPERVLALIRSFFEDVNSAKPWLVIGSCFAVFSLGKAIEVLKRKVRQAYNTDPKVNGLVEWIVSFAFAVAFIVSLYGVLLILFWGEDLLYALSERGFLSVSFFHWISRLQFLLYGAIFFLIVLGINFVLPAAYLSFKDVFPGTAVSVLGILLSSRLFSLYVDQMNGFSLLYGSLSGFIVLLAWLYLFSYFVLLGTQINAYLYKSKREAIL